jgi:ankyrin repeat protein
MRQAIRTFGWLVLALSVSASAPPDAPVADAAQRGDLDAVTRLVEAGADVNTPHGDGMTALHWAAEAGDSVHYAGASGDPEAVDLLVRHGADVEAREAVWGQTPLVFASSAGRLETVRALIDAGGDLSAATNVIDVTEMIAEDVDLKARRDALKAIEWGLDLADEGYAETGGREDEQLREEAEERKGPLELPDSARERLSFAELMNKKGGLTALHHAAREGSTDVAMHLIERGADVNQTSGDLSTPLLVATINGHFDLAMELLSRGADPNLRSVAGAGPLYAALNLQWGATSWYPQPTAHKQQRTSYLEYMRALLDAGADPNARLVMDLWYTEFSGGNLNVSQWGATPFWRAAYGTDVDAMRLLVSYGADPNIPAKKLPERANQYGEELEDYPYPPVPTGGPATYPIHAASGAGYGLGFAGNAHQHAPDGWLPSVKYLVEELGVDPNLRDHQGYTAVHNAATRGDNEVITYLVSKGADVTLVSRYGQTTADMANGPYQRLNPFPETLALLEGLGAVNNDNCVGC